MPRGDYEVFADGFPGLAEFDEPRGARASVPSASPWGPTARSSSPTPRRAGCGGSSTRGRREPVSAAAAASRHPLQAARAAATPAPWPTRRACRCAHGQRQRRGRTANRRGRKRNSHRRSEHVIRVVLRGPAAVLPAGKTSANQMPPFAYLSDQDVAAALTYVRREFGKGAGPVTPAQVGQSGRSPSRPAPTGSRWLSCCSAWSSCRWAPRSPWRSPVSADLVHRRPAMRERSFTRDADGEARLALEIPGVQVRVEPVVSLQRAPHASPGIFALGTRQAAIGMLGVAGDHDVVDQEGEGRIQHHLPPRTPILASGRTASPGPTFR